MPKFVISQLPLRDPEELPLEDLLRRLEERSHCRLTYIFTQEVKINHLWFNINNALTKTYQGHRLSMLVPVLRILLHIRKDD